VREKKIKGKNFSQKVVAAVNASILTEEEGQQCLAAYSARMKIINVDDFSPEALRSRFESTAASSAVEKSGGVKGWKKFG